VRKWEEIKILIKIYSGNGNAVYARSKAPEVRNIGRIKIYPITSGATRKAGQRGELSCAAMLIQQ
jgi:hypothetical protein